MATDTYAMEVGDGDTERLALLGQFYDPNSGAFLASAGQLCLFSVGTAVGPRRVTH
jgi:hypothetical protein